MEGRLLAGRYRLIHRLGQGGMGSVWCAQHLELGTQVAVKLMDPSLVHNAGWLARFRCEAQAAASLQSPHVVSVFDFGVDGDTPYIAMEMLRGESLDGRLQRVQRLPIDTAVTILIQVARAIGKAHDAGIVHRDLKPDNIFLVQDDDEEIVKVLDFGIAKCTRLEDPLGAAVHTLTGSMLGSPYYMSPEQVEGRKDVDHLSDIWSYGAIASECLTGVRVFYADTLGGVLLAICTKPIQLPSQLGEVPPGFDAWFSRCVARERSERFQTIREAGAGLAALAHVERNGWNLRQRELQVPEESSSARHTQAPDISKKNVATYPCASDAATAGGSAPPYSVTHPCPEPLPTRRPNRPLLWLFSAGLGFAFGAGGYMVSTGQDFGRLQALGAAIMHASAAILPPMPSTPTSLELENAPEIELSVEPIANSATPTAVECVQPPAISPTNLDASVVLPARDVEVLPVASTASVVAAPLALAPTRVAKAPRNARHATRGASRAAPQTSHVEPQRDAAPPAATPPIAPPASTPAASTTTPAASTTLPRREVDYGI